MTKITAEDLKAKLTEKLNAKFVEVIDDSDNCGLKFRVTIVSEAFRGLPLLKKHRLVNTTLSEELKDIHAFSQKTYTPEEWGESAVEHDRE